jgi:2-polyprenyl-3-methyl-5-hydroxy-6-metoxy-1,4-benzoquinol methylase
LTDTTEGDRAKRFAELGFNYAERPKEQRPTCELCGGRTTAEVSRCDRYGFPAVLRVCVCCGLGWLSPRLTRREYDAFYRNVYRALVSAYHGQRIDALTIQDEQRVYAEELFAFLQYYLTTEPSTVLDIGGSTGVVSASLHDAYGAHVTVVDPAREELAVAAAAGMETVEGFIEDFDTGQRRWDLVLLCQTIDHLLELRTTIERIRSFLRPGGHAFIDVVDLPFAFRRAGQVEGAVKIDHPYYLTRSTAIALFGLAGLSVVAERLSEGGEWGFLLKAGHRRKPDWAALRTEADCLLDEVWRRRAVLA